MKKMICEICGSQSIKKENGVFVCQECGTEYSLEEAKKLLTELGESEPITKPTEKKDEQNTDVHGKEKLLCTLLLWAENVQYMSNVYEYFDIPQENVLTQGFWLNFKKLVKSKNVDELFPKIDGMYRLSSGETSVDHSLSDRFYNGSDENSKFNNFLQEYADSGKLIGYRTYLSYASELTNGPDNLYKLYKAKYYMKTKSGGSKEYLNDHRSISGLTYLLVCCSPVVYYEEYSKMWGTHKLLQSAVVTQTLKGLDSKIKEIEAKCAAKHNKLMDLYKKEYPEIVKQYTTIVDNCAKLEKELFLPYQYRDASIVYEMIDMVRSGKATSWKELVNLYDTTSFRKTMVEKIDGLSEQILDLKNVMIEGFKYVAFELQGMNSKLSSINTSLSNISMNAIKIKNYSFITMLSSI
jgi:hypothetical protein